MRRFLSLRSQSSPSTIKATIQSDSHTVHDNDIDNRSEPSEKGQGAESAGSENTAIQFVPLPPAPLKIKKVDHFYSRWQKKWKYTTTGSNIIPEIRSVPSDSKDEWQDFCFVVVREVPDDSKRSPYFRIVVKSSYLLQACKDVIREVVGVSWNAIPLTLDPVLLLTFFPQFVEYRDSLSAKKKLQKEEENTLNTVNVLIDYFLKDYRETIASIRNLTAHGEITFELLYAILVPRSIMLARNMVTNELQALELVSAALVCDMGTPYYSILLEAIDVDDSEVLSIKGYRRVQVKTVIPFFGGTLKITSLDVYPLSYHPDHVNLRQTFLERGKKWAKYAGGIHHLSYEGTGAVRIEGKVLKYNLNSRVMVDRANFRRLNPNYEFPKPKLQVPLPAPDSNPRRRHRPIPPSSPSLSVIDTPVPLLATESYVPSSMTGLTDEELVLAIPLLYAFSLSDKLWLELNVDKVKDIEWDEDAFDNLVLPADRKMLLKSLIEAHNQQLGFDDFIKGKGRGLVVNLFGSPGVGKTLSAEATSEHVRRPLYIVGAGDLGTSAAKLDTSLQAVFDLATAWKAIVLIDEADVFLEERSLHDLERNAMVAVFLRHMEYYPAILFLTTNRVRTFDDAFLSRIHIALHFHDLSRDARKSIWKAFLSRAGATVGSDDSDVTEEQLDKLSDKDINGRQVKNAVKTACSLAVSRGEKLGYKHFSEVLNVMEQFRTEFQTMRQSGMYV